MDPRWLVLLTLTFTLLPAQAHEPPGTVKGVCELEPEWQVHEYAPLASGEAATALWDSTLEDCGNGYPLIDYDAHSDFAVGGAWLLVTTGDEWTGSLGCYGEVGHHPAYGPVTVEDVALGQDVEFIVTADLLVNVTDEAAAWCGDFEEDASVTCRWSCTVPFPPGPDGAYVVKVRGTQGHVRTDAGPGGSPLTTYPSGQVVLVDLGPAPPALARKPMDWACTGPVEEPGDEYVVVCRPPPGIHVCRSVSAQGEGVPALREGSLEVVSSCDGLIASTGQSGIPSGEGSVLVQGSGGFPWTCRVRVDAPKESVWTAICAVN